MTLLSKCIILYQRTSCIIVTLLPAEEDCMVEAIRVLFNTTCEKAVIILNVIAFGVLALILICIMIFIKVR